MKKIEWEYAFEVKPGLLSVERFSSVEEVWEFLKDVSFPPRVFMRRTGSYEWLHWWESPQPKLTDKLSVFFRWRILS